jgi:ribonuclease Z
VIAGRTLVVVDAGTNGVRNLQRMGFRPGGIRALFLTHFHSDHIDGLGELAMQRWVGDAHTAPLPVYGPPGVEQIVAGFNLAYRADFGYRTAHHGEAIAPPSGAGTVAHAYALPAPGTPSEIWNRDGLLVEAFAVDHEPAHPAVGYRFAYGGRTLVISGDTRRIEGMVDAARDADLLVHEALAPELVARLTSAAEHAGQAGLARITRDILDYHTTPVQAAELAAAANVRALVLYHIVPPLLLPGAEAAFVRNVSDAFAGAVTVARDGTLVSLPAAAERIEYDQRL